MKSKVQMIRWCVFLSIPFLVGAYLFSVHDIKYEHHSLFSDQWLSDNFLMTIFSGTFASFLVVILCELGNYKSSKSEQEQHIFDTNTHLFITLYTMGKKLYDFTHGNYWNNNINDLLPDLKDSEKNFNLELTKLGSTEYTPVIPSFRNNSLFAKYESYKNNFFGKENISEDLFKLENILERKTQGYAPTSNENEYVILSKMLKNVTELLTMADNFNKSLDTHCDGRFQWEKLKNVYRDKGFSIPK